MHSVWGARTGAVILILFSGTFVRIQIKDIVISSVRVLASHEVGYDAVLFFRNLGGESPHQRIILAQCSWEVFYRGYAVFLFLLMNKTL